MALGKALSWQLAASTILWRRLLVTAISSLGSHRILLVAGGAFLLFLAVKDAFTGKTRLPHQFDRTVTRSENPVLYWFSVLLSAILGIGMVLAVVLR
jgi:hypothetical protein